jgi:hypothetical protein
VWQVAGVEKRVLGNLEAILVAPRSDFVNFAAGGDLHNVQCKVGASSGFVKPGIYILVRPNRYLFFCQISNLPDVPAKSLDPDRFERLCYGGSVLPGLLPLVPGHVAGHQPGGAALAAVLVPEQAGLFPQQTVESRLHDVDRVVG